MQQHSTLHSPPLDPFRSSPVRGQLEPYDPKTPNGWRYIQTTDTRNQLKVLLPPGTASMYEQLLKFEVFELRKKATLSWERILEIRHLKDRMIRKCHKLAKSSSSGKPSDPFTFQTIIAPSDFRVKAMENWFQQQQKRTNALLRRPPARPTGLGTSDLASRSAERSQSGRENINMPSSDRHLAQLPASSNGGKRLPEHPETRFLPQPPKSTLPTKKSAFLTTRPAIPAPVPTSSPPPLPHLLRIRDPETGFDLSADPQEFISHYPFDSDTKASPPDSKFPPTPLKQQFDIPGPELRRQRSCIKRTSMGDLVKTVSWADDRGLAEQVSKYTSVVRDVYTSGRKWGEIRSIYMEQMAGLETLHQQVEKSLEHIRSESEHLLRTDEMIRRQRSILQSTFQELEQKQMLLQAKVQAELEEAEQLFSHSTLTEKVSAHSVMAD